MMITITTTNTATFDFVLLANFSDIINSVCLVPKSKLLGVVEAIFFIDQAPIYLPNKQHDNWSVLSNLPIK